MKKLLLILLIITPLFAFTQQKAIVMFKHCKLCEKPSMFSSANTILQKGDTVTILEDHGILYLAQHDNIIGYIYTNSVSIIAHKNKRVKMDCPLKISDYKSEIKHIRLNMGKYYKGRQKGLCFGIGAGALSVAGAATNENILYVGAGAAGLVSLFFYLDSEKYLKNIYLGTEGIGVKFSIN